MGNKQMPGVRGLEPHRKNLDGGRYEILSSLKDITSELMSDGIPGMAIGGSPTGVTLLWQNTDAQRILPIITEGCHALPDVLQTRDVMAPLWTHIKKRLYTAVQDFSFSSFVDTERVVSAYMTHLNRRGDPFGLMLCELDHMVEAMYTAKSIMDNGPDKFSEHRDAIGLAALFHDVYAVTRKPGVEIGNPFSLTDYLARNIGHKQEKKWNKEIIDELAIAAIGQKDELYDLLVTAVDFSSGKHKMSPEDWDRTQWVTPMRIADNMSTQRTYGDRHLHLVYNWAVDAYQGVESQEDIAGRIIKRKGFCDMLAEGKIKELLQDQIMARKKINMAEEYPGLLERIENSGGLDPVKMNPITAYTTTLQIAMNSQLNELFPAFAEAGYDRMAYTLKQGSGQ